MIMHLQGRKILRGWQSDLLHTGANPIMDDRIWVHLQKIVSTVVLKMDNRIQARLHKNIRILVGRLSIITKDGRSYTNLLHRVERY